MLQIMIRRTSCEQNGINQLYAEVDAHNSINSMHGIATRV